MNYQFTKEKIEESFLMLSREAERAGKKIDIAVYGGSAIVLAFDYRTSTKDVDAIMSDQVFVKEAAKKVATELDLPENWINDGVKGYISAKQNEPGAITLFRSYPSEDNSVLRVFVPSKEYLLAMKCLAMRDLKDSEDINDINNLIGDLKFTNSKEVINLVSKFYPDNLILPKVKFGIEEIIEKSNLESPLEQNKDVKNNPTIAKEELIQNKPDIAHSETIKRKFKR
ncbi:MAG: DUF6036 family nucleotidyltransferase [bacterium]